MLQYKEMHKLKILKLKDFITLQTLSDFINSTIQDLLKSDSHLPKNFVLICLIESPLKMMKNVFYFILKALFVLKIFKFLSGLFGHVEKMA